jgi:hypothetical protein
MSKCHGYGTLSLSIIIMIGTYRYYKTVTNIYAYGPTYYSPYPGNFDKSVQRPVEVLGPVVPLAVADLLGCVEGEEGRVTVHPRAEVIHQPVAVHETLLPEHHALRLQPAIEKAGL